VAHFVWQDRPTHGPPHTNWVPCHPARDRRALARQWGVQRGSESICEGEGREPPPDGGIPATSPLTALRGSFFFPARQAVSLRLLARWSLVGHCRRNGGGRPPQHGVERAYSSPAPCCGDRSPGAFWSPALVESVDRWPLASPDTKIPGGSRPVVAVVRRRCPRGPVPPPEGRMPQATSARKGVFWGHCVRTGT